MTDHPLFIERLEDLIEAFPPNSILSRTIYQDDSIKAVLFGFQPGQELSQHTASVPAILQFVKGDAKVVLGQEHQSAQAGTWVAAGTGSRNGKGAIANSPAKANSTTGTQRAPKSRAADRALREMPVVPIVAAERTSRSAEGRKARVSDPALLSRRRNSAVNRPRMVRRYWLALYGAP